MSFVHHARVGFFGIEGEALPERELALDECVRLVSDYNAVVPQDCRIKPLPPPRGNAEHGFAIAYSDGHPIVLRRGYLECPYLTTHYIMGAIGFGAFVQKATGCSIYLEDRFVTVAEFIPDRPFSAVMRDCLRESRSGQ